MSAVAVVLLFGVSCPQPCGAKAYDLQAIEKDVVIALTTRGFSVRPAPKDAEKPTGSDAPPAHQDVAEKMGVDRVVALDLESGERVLWITHFVRGAPGAWSIGKVRCGRQEGGVLGCPGLDRAVSTGLRPRKRNDVDVTAALRHAAKKVSACVADEDKVPVAERVFGRIEMDLEALPSGHVRVVAIAPVRAARSGLGKCLRTAMQSMNVGAFEGAPLKFRVPVDL